MHAKERATTYSWGCDVVELSLRITQNLPAGAGAAGLAGLRRLAPKLAGQRVGIVISGGNLSSAALARAVGDAS